MAIFIIYNQNENINKIVYEQYSNIQSRVKEMIKQYFFIDFLQEKNYFLKQYWLQLLTTITNNCCLPVNHLGYIFLYENNLTFLLDYGKFPQFHFTEGIQIQNYFIKFKQYCHFIKVKENRFKVILSYLEHFVRTSAKILSGYHNQIKLNIEPLGELQFKNQTIIFSNKKIIYKLSQKKNLSEKLPNLLNLKQTLNSYQNTSSSDLVKIERKFSLSIIKKSKETPVLKKSQSSKYLANQSYLQVKNKSKNLQNSQTSAFNKNSTFLMKPQNISENRILRLKSQASQKHEVLINKKSRRKIKCKTVQNSYPDSSLNILQKNPKRKLVKSKSNYDILRVQEQFRLSTMLKGTNKLSNINQSSKKITPEKSKNNFTFQQKSKFSQLKSEFSNQMKSKKNKLRLQLKNQNNGNKKSQEVESRLKTSQFKSNQHKIQHKKIFTQKIEFAISQVKCIQNLDRNNYFVTLKAQGMQSKLASQQKSTSEYKNNFLKRSISKYRKHSDQNIGSSKEEKKNYIIFEKSQQLINSLSDEFPFQLSTINQMIQQFQQIWKSNRFSFFKKEKSATIININSLDDRKSDFYLFYNAHIEKKVQIQRQKIKYTEIIANSGYKKTINVQKIVNQIQKYFKNTNQALIQDNQDEKQLPVIHFSRKKFKPKVQQQTIHLIYQVIEKFKYNIRKISPIRGFQVKNNSFQQEKNINKLYLSRSVINFKQLLLKTRQLIHQIRNFNAQLFTSENFSSKQNNQKVFNLDQNRKIGPEIALFLREVYITLNELFLSIAHYTQHQAKSNILLRIEIHLQSFWLIQQLTIQTISYLKSIFTEVQKQIEIWYAPMKIQQFEKKQLIRIQNMFRNLLLETFQSPTFLAKRQEYLSKMEIVFQPKCYFQVEKMKKDLLMVDQFYESKILQETESLDINCVTVDITEAKLKLAKKLRKSFAQVQSSYQVYLKNLVSDLDKTLRNCVQIKPEMLFQQNYKQVKNKYLSKISQIEEVFMFIIQRRSIYLEYRPKTLVQIFHKLQQKRLKLYQYLSNLDSRLNLYRKNMEQEITAIQIIDKRLKQTLKQLSIKLKSLINDLKDERDIGFNEKRILEMKEMFDSNNTEKIQLIKRMQVNQIIYWEDDTYFQKNIKALLSSLEFIKSDKYKLIYQSSISQIDWKQFLIFINSYSKLMNLLDETKILKIFKSNYDVFIQNSKFIEVILYKGYSMSDLQKFSTFELKLTKDSHQKLPSLIKRIAQMDKKSHEQILSILHAAKQNQFYGLKRLAIINVKIEFQKLQYFSQSLKDYQIYQIKNVQDILDQMTNLSCNQCEQFINNIQKFNQIAHELFYLKKTLINLHAIQQHSKEKFFKSFHQRYWQLYENLKSQNKIYLKYKDVQKLFDQIQQQREKLAEIFFNQKVRFFPRLSLLDINSLIDCFDWKNLEQIVKNVQSLYGQIDDVIIQKDTRKIKKLRIGSDYIQFQKQLDPQAFNSIQFLKFLYASVQGLIQDSVSQSFKRICHMKIIAWYIYFTEQIECTFLLKGNLHEIRSRIELLIKQIGQQLRYDMYQHHKKYEIQQLKFFVDFVAKLQKIQDPQNSYLWANSIKIYQKNKKVIISQNDNQYEFGYQPKKPEAFDPQFKIEKGLKYGTSQHIQLYRLSANIAGRPFVIMNLRKSALKNRMYKILDIIYKYDFFAVIDHDAIFENQKYSKLPSKCSSFIQKKKSFQSLKENEQNQLFYLKENSKYSLINQFYKELIYFSSYKQQLQGARQVKLPILVKYQKINLIPTNFRAQFRTIDRPSKLFSLQLMVLIQLNKYQDFFAKYEINLGKISSFFKLINEEFAMSFEKLTKILKDFDKFISKIDKSNKEKCIDQGEIEENQFKSTQHDNQEENIKSKNKKSEFSKFHEDEQESSESSKSQVSEEITQKSRQLNKNQEKFQDIKNKKYLIQFPQKQNNHLAQQQTDNKQKFDKESSVEMSKKINKQLFKILVHYYPDGELQISKIIQYLTTQSASISQQSDQIYQSIQKLKLGGPNIIVYGQMSEKTTLIKKYLKYGKNQFIVQTEELQRKNIEIYYLEGLINYFVLKSKANKFLIETESIHGITPTQITETLIYIPPLSKLQIQENFCKKLNKIFSSSCYKDHYKPAFEKDCWTCFSDLYQIYAECQGAYSLVSKIDTFLNILQKQFTISRQQRTKKKIDGKILLKQLITIMIQLFIYSLDTQNRKKMIVQSKKKKYFQLNELKGINVEDLYNYTSINLQTQKIEQLIKRQRFIFKNIFPIQRQIAIAKKYFSLEKKYIRSLLNLQQENDTDMAEIKQELSGSSPLKNFNFLFLTENHIINDTLHRFFKQQFVEDFKNFKKYIPNSKFIHKCIEDTPLNIEKRQSLKKSKTLIVIQDLHLAIKQEQTSIKILLDHYAQFDKSKFYIFFMNKYIPNSDKDMVKNPKKFSYMSSLVFVVGQVNFQSIFKYQIKNGLHQNTVQRVKKLRCMNGLLDNDVDYLKFVLNCQVKLPSQLYEKFFIASVILFSLTSSPEFEDFHAKYGTSQTQHKMSLTELRAPQNFFKKLETTICRIQNTLNVSYKYSSFVKRKSYMQLTESQIQKTIQKVINLFGKHFILQNQSKILNKNDRKKQSTIIETRQQNIVNCNNKFSVQYLLKNHLRKYLHLSLSSEKIYIIEEQITVLPYLISQIHENRLYTLSEEINFIEKFIEIVIKQMQTSKQRDNSNQSFIILIKPPLALTQLFSQILNLIIKKTNFLDYCSEFQFYVNSQKQKAQFIYNQLDLYEEKIKLFYKTVFNQCKFIISIKECHKSLFTKIIEPEQKFIRQFSFKQQNRVCSTKSKKRLSQRDSLINRQLFRSSQVFSFKKYQEYYKNDVSSVNKLGKDFWQQIVYLNLVMSVKEKLNLSKYLIKKYFKFFCEQSKGNTQNISQKQQESIHEVEKKNIQSSDLQKLVLQFEYFMTEILQTILEEYSLPIRSIDLMIKENIELILDRKSDQRNYLDLKILKEEIEIPQNINRLKLFLQKTTCILENQIQSQTKIKNFLLDSINSHSCDKNQSQKTLKVMGQQNQETTSNLPRRKQKICSFIHQNQKEIQSLKQQFYFSTIQHVQQMYLEAQFLTQKSQNLQESSKSSFYSVRSKVEARKRNSEGKSVFLQKLFEKLSSGKSLQQFNKIFNQNFIIIEDKLLPKKFSLSLARLFHEAKLKVHRKQQQICKQQRNNAKRVSIEKNTLQITPSRNKSNSKIRISQSSKGKTKNSSILDQKISSKLKLDENMRKSNHQNAVDIQTMNKEINNSPNTELKMDFLSINESQFVSSYPQCTLIDLIYQRYIRFIVSLYEKYHFQKNCQNDDSKKQKIAAFQSQIKNVQYFLSIDLLTIQKEQLRHLQEQILTTKKQLQMLKRYIQICQKFTKVNNKHSHIMSEEDQGGRQLISQQVKRNIYEMIFMNTLSNIKDNSQLNDRIKKILCIDNQHSLLSSIKKLSKNRINLTLSQQIQIKTLEEKSKFIIADPYHEFNHLIKNFKAQIIFINKGNLHEVKKLRFKLVFFVFYVESMQNYYQIKDLIDQVNRIIEQKATDSKSNNQKLVLLVSTKKILDQLNIEEEHYTTLNLEFTYMKFSQQINIKKQKLSRQETQNLFESYTNAYSKLFKLSKQIGKLSVDQKDEILACLQKAQKPVLNHFQTLTKQIESIYEEKNKRNFEEGKCTVIYQYLSKLIEQEIIPYRYVKRINQKLDWSKMEELISTYSKTRRKQVPTRAVPTGFKQQIKEWLGKQLLALRSQTFLDQFKECIAVSNVIVLVYEILHQKIFKQIQMIAQSQKIDFSFFFEFPNLKKRDFLIDIDETGQVNFHQNSKQKQLNLNILDKDLVKNSFTSFDNFERQTNKAFGRNSMARKKKTDDSLENIDYSQKKKIYFVHEKEIYKVKEVIHICSIIWV